MQAFHGKQEIKDLYINRVIAHQAADEIIKGHYWEYGKGCAVGCTIHGDDHGRYETELGIPKFLALLEDVIFEYLPCARAKEWPREFLSAITPGQDLEKIKIPILIFIVESAREAFDHKKYPKQLAVTDNVLTELCRDFINVEALQAASADAAAAASSFSFSAASSSADAAYAAYASAYAAAAASSFSFSAASSSAYAIGGNSFVVKFADKVLELIKEDRHFFEGRQK